MDDELRSAHHELSETHWWFRGRSAIIEAVIRRHVGTTVSSVLDVGCGPGGMLSALAELGPVHAVEADRASVERARARNPQAVVVEGVLPHVLHDVPSASLVTALDVIEHLDDDVATLRLIADRLLPGGRVCVTVPAQPWLWGRHDERNDHRRRYTASTLDQAFAHAGLRIIHMSYYNTLLLPLVAASRLLERLRPATDQTDFDRGGKFLGPVLERALSVERHIVSRWRVPIGVSLIAIAEVDR